MKKDIELLIEKFNSKYKQHSLWKKIVSILSCIAIFITIYFLTIPAITLNNEISYNLYLKDSYNYSWKKGLTKEYNLNLYFMDTNGIYIEGKDVTINIGPDGFIDDPYGFGYVPISGETTRGMDIIEALGLREYVLNTGEKYVFDHAEVYVNDTWQTFTSTSNHWDIWCQYSSSETLPSDYGWRGKYGENINYTITDTTEYKFVYKLVRYGIDNAVSSLGSDSGISFKMFNYNGDNNQIGINDNGLYGNFTFRGITSEYTGVINQTIDADGYNENRARILPNLENGYPVFDCRGNCTNMSLGYLFGSETNSIGETTKGVTKYIPTNTLLQKETINDVEYYYYDSNRNAVDYDTTNNRFMLRSYVERGYSMSGYLNETERYEFLPFNYLNNTSEDKIIDDTNFTYQYEEKEIDHWFGMTMEFNFYMPKDGMINNTDMIFAFSGDDDVWVFVDDVLVLDLGGTHGAVDGSINFHTGEVSAFLNWNGTKSTPNETTIYQSYSLANKNDSIIWNDTNKTFDDYTLHNVKFFYLERGASISNCTIKFNIPVLPSGSLSVQKLFDGPEQYVDDYEFTLYDVTNGNQNVVSNTEYTIGDKKFVTDANGRFTLKSNEVATFILTNDHEYYVKETNSGEHSQSFKCSLDGVDCKEINQTQTFTIKPDSAYQATFTNKIKTYNLKVSKIAYASENTENFGFSIKLKNNDGTLFNTLYNVNDLNINSKNHYEIDKENSIITYSLKNDENIIINDIPLNTTIFLQEVTHDGYNVAIKSSDIVLANGDNYEFIIDSNKDITVYNTPGVMLPETGGNGIWNYLLVGSIFILISTRFGYIYFFKQKGDKMS